MPDPVLFLSGIRWDFARQRHQHLAEGFARRHPVLFVEMGLSPTHLLRPVKGTVSHWRNWMRGRQEAGKNLWIYTAPPALPFARRVLGIQRINLRFMYQGVGRALAALNMDRPLVWVSDPYFGAIPPEMRRGLVVFDWIHAGGEEEESRRGRVYRALLASVRDQADLIFTPSRLVMERYGAGDRRFHYLPHGVSEEWLQAAPGSPPPPEIASLPRPIIGFSGTVGPVLDAGLLGALARLRPDWSFVLIGEIRLFPGVLPSAPNIIYLGPRPPRELPRYLGAFSAGIIPYRVCPETETVHPVKTYEYLAAGLPVVSTPLPEIRHLAGTVDFAASAEDFIRSLEDLIAGDTPEKKEARRHFARDNSWAKRVEEIERIIAEVEKE
ncbi:MAG: glycosyltransferase [Candidatus Aureabacteria bacterium]|nr:glycosyltransferase [Candidatus Auribacterota bacterium]